MDYDLVIRNGTVIDGTRLPRFRADLGIKWGKVRKIGRIGQVRAGRDRMHRRAGFRRPSYALRRPDSLGSVLHDFRVARCHLVGARQLRLRVCSG
jgi:hypothetical protein